VGIEESNCGNAVDQRQYDQIRRVSTTKLDARSLADAGSTKTVYGRWASFNWPRHGDVGNLPVEGICWRALTSLRTQEPATNGTLRNRGFGNKGLVKVY
jgi:hypothetical protein